LGWYAFRKLDNLWMIVRQFFDIRMVGVVWLTTRPRAVNTAVRSSSHKHCYFRFPLPWRFRRICCLVTRLSDQLLILDTPPADSRYRRQIAVLIVTRPYIEAEGLLVQITG
jgi:hypothetical protein